MAYIGKRPQDTFPANNAVTSSIISENAVGSSEIATNAVTTLQIADNAVTGVKIAENGITSRELAANTIATGNIADNAIDSTKIAQNSILTKHIDDGQITSDQILDGTIAAGDIASDAVTTAKILNANVTTPKLADSSVSTAKIADDAVTTAKMASLARGAILVGDASGNPSSLALGSNGLVLKSDGSDLVFAADSGLSSEQVQDIVGAMFSSNTETGITGTYQDSDGTIDLVVGTLNQDTTGNAATATALETARTIHGVSFDGSANIDLSEVVQDTVGAMFSGNTETNITATYQDSDGTIDLEASGTTHLNNTSEPAYHKITVTVVSDSGNKYALDGGTQAIAKLTPSVVYRFDQSDSSNSGHPFRIGTAANGSEISSGTILYNKVGSPGSAGAYTEVAFEQDAPGLLYYYCSSHSGMGSTISVADESTLTQTLTNKTLTSPNITGLQLGGTTVTSTAAELNILDGVTATAAELNIIDGDTSATSTTLANADRVVINDAGTMKQVALSDLATYMGDNVTINQTQTALTVSGNTTIGGNLTVNGTTTTLNTTNSVISDRLIELGNGTSGSPANDMGIVMERGSAANAFMGFDESADKFIVGTGTFTGSSTGDLTITTGTLVANVEGNVTGNLTGDVTGDVTGNVTGNTSGSAATVTGAAQTAITSLGTLSTLTVDDININGSTISDAGDLTIDAGGDIILDGDGADFIFKDDGTEFARLSQDGNNFVIKSSVSDEDIILKGNDGGTSITAVTLDMSDAGTAIFNHDIKFGDDGKALFGAGSDLQIYHDGNHSRIVESGSGDMIIQGDEFSLMNVAGTEYMIFADNDSFVKLYYDGSNKLETTATGVTITGVAVATSFTGALTGNASTATALATGRTVGMTGDVVWTSASFDGSGNVTGSATIQADAVEQSMIADDAVGADQLAANSVVSASIVNGSIVSADIAANTIATSNVADNAIDATKIASNSILTRHIDDNQITGDQIADDIVLSGTGALRMPDGTTAQRPGSAAAGMFRYNTTLGKFEGYTDAWGEVGGGGSNGFLTDIFDGTTTPATDGSRVAFTMSQAVTDEKFVMVFIDGVYQAHAAYSVSGTTLTMADAPVAGRVLTVHTVSAAVQGDGLTINNFSGDGSDTTFTLNVDPTHENNTQVYIDGVYQFKNTYSVSGTTLTFSTAPPNGSGIEVMVHSQTTINSAGSLAAGAVSGLSEVTIAGADHLMLFDATDNALKKGLASDLIEQLTTEQVQDVVGAMVSSNTETGVAVSYEDGDGTLDFVLASAQPTITSVGTLTTLTVDDITINGSTISDGGDLTLDVAGDIILDADGGEIFLKDDGTTFGELSISGGSDLVIQSSIADKDILFVGTDSSSVITALTLDMSAAGAATFNSTIALKDTLSISNASTSGFLQVSSDVLQFGTSSADPVVFFQGNTERMRINTTGGIEAVTTEAKCLQLNSTHSNGPYLSFQESGGSKFYIGKRSAVGGTSGTGYDLYAAGNYDIAFYTNAARRWSINTSGHLTPHNQHTYDIGGTNAEVRNIYAQGISFASNANASGMTSELLDDYEEGTFTPTFSGATLSAATGTYTKIGNQVTVHFRVVTSGGLPSSGGQVQVGNLPFTAASGFGGAGSLYVGPSNVSSATGGGGAIVPFISGSEAFIRFVNVDTGTLGYTLWGELEVSSNNVVTAIGTQTYQV